MQKKKFPLPVKAVMIDLDGTMLDTVADLAIAVNLMLKELDRAPLEEIEVRNFVGKGIPNLVGRVLTRSFGEAPGAAQLDRALPLYLECYESVNGKHTTMYAGVLEGLDALKTAGYPLACVTNKSERFTLPLLKQVRLADYFAIVVAGDTLAKKKPDPLPLTHVCERLAIDPRDMLMIGDSLNDTIAARAAGCPVFCVTYGYNEGVDVRDLDVDAIVESLFEATKLIVRS